ncbi:MAG: VOC family protein [Rhodospirillaceae bacterium]|jgi:catechol 2,3-dioxygenase-like lactoylglutathione lyase family enzyme|nr:VOC family protein [Rhodospirillaceae bacterium]MBT5245652.1 VOC family protein [Rhodospirillaceae bacterium]MBT5561873.1 VOC family protein [Rhodospirillaceae bacterium]MBT6240479.1 VOC family protein [Rhodospirillaceae bacterium]MBT7136560.1 VOC family protein [Rhodospirillaceae bacterium]
MKILSLDHLVLTVADLDVTSDFYCRVLGMEDVRFSSGGIERRALKFGEQKINLHLAGSEFEPKAADPKPGSADLCLIVDEPIKQVMAHLQDMGVTPEEGPVQRTGATGPILSVYFRDPDGNLIEVSRYTD